MSGRILTPQEPIQNTPFSVGDFWSWAYSDILTNTTRSVFGEFLVASALGEISQPRIEWDGYDVSYRGYRIEVKTSAYLQSWTQTQLSKIRFDIGKKLAWDSQSNIYAQTPLRTAQIYVFCLYTEQDKTQVNILNIEKWHFFAVNTATLEQTFGSQKSIQLSALQPLCIPIGYYDLKQHIDLLIAEIELDLQRSSQSGLIE